MRLKSNVDSATLFNVFVFNLKLRLRDPTKYDNGELTTKRTEFPLGRNKICTKFAGGTVLCDALNLLYIDEIPFLNYHI